MKCSIKWGTEKLVLQIFRFAQKKFIWRVVTPPPIKMKALQRFLVLHIRLSRSSCHKKINSRMNSHLKLLENDRCCKSVFHTRSIRLKSGERKATPSAEFFPPLNNWSIVQHDWDQRYHRFGKKFIVFLNNMTHGSA